MIKKHPSKTGWRDFRRIGRDAQEAARIRAVSLVLREGYSQREAAELVGVHRQIVNAWIRRHRFYGANGLLDGRRFSGGSNGILKIEEFERVQRWMRYRMPDRMKLPFALWTVEAVSAIIRRKLRKTVAPSTTLVYLKRAGFRSATPPTRAKRRAASMEIWLANDYPAIAQRAKSEKAIIYWAIELRNAEVLEPSARQASKRLMPRQVPQRSQKLSGQMIAAVSNRCLMRFMFFEGPLTGSVIINFMGRLIKDVKQRVFLIVDDSQRARHSKAVQDWLAENNGEIKMFYIPGE